GAENSGFGTTLGVFGMAELEVGLRAVLQDQTRVPLGTIEAQRCWNEDAGGEPSVVSVVIPCYNQARFLGEAIESVLAQSYPLFEIVVVDDGSTDDTSGVAARYPGVRCVRQRNQGLAAARNAGLRESKGGYLVFLDADDRLLPDALEVGLACLEARPECAFASGHYRNIAADGSPLPTPQQPHIDKEHYLEILRANYIITPAVVIHRRAALDSVNGFSTSSSVKNTEDYDLCLRIARQFAVHCHGRLVAEYRLHGSSMSHDHGTMLKSTLNVLRSQWKYVEGNERFEDAYEKGVRTAQSYYGEPLIDAVRAHLQEREWRRALRGMLVLQRCYPEGLESLLGEHGSRLFALGEAESEQQPDLKKGTEISHNVAASNILEQDHVPAVGHVDFGSLRRVTPVSREWGFDRGLPVDRYYIEDFLVRRTRDIRGHVLEIGDALYTRKYGGERVTNSDVLHVTEGNPQATIVADLTCADDIPSNTFDCVIVTQTLHLIYDVRSAIHTLQRILKPGGTVLATFPGISQIEKAYPWGTWYWAFTTPSARRLFEECFPSENVKVETYGNVLAAISFLHGLAAGELSRGELDYRDPDYEVLIALTAVKKAKEFREESHMPRSNWIKGLLRGIMDSIGSGRRDEEVLPDERVVAELTATPNPVPAGPGAGTTTIQWSTGDDSEGQVYLRVGDEPEQLFSRGARGSQEASFIRAGPAYEFRLYSGTQRERLLASVEVTRNRE
ncbi:MAG: glycosyltransferase, partial [Rubrobacteraceae bacterium]